MLETLPSLLNFIVSTSRCLHSSRHFFPVLILSRLQALECYLNDRYLYYFILSMPFFYLSCKTTTGTHSKFGTLNRKKITVDRDIFNNEGDDRKCDNECHQSLLLNHTSLDASPFWSTSLVNDHLRGFFVFSSSDLPLSQASLPHFKFIALSCS